MKIITSADIMGFSPCFNVEERYPDGKGTLLDILKMEDVTVYEKIWVATRPGICSKKVSLLFAMECVRAVLGLVEGFDVPELPTLSTVADDWDPGRIADWTGEWSAWSALFAADYNSWNHPRAEVAQGKYTCPDIWLKAWDIVQLANQPYSKSIWEGVAIMRINYRSPWTQYPSAIRPYERGYSWGKAFDAAKNNQVGRLADLLSKYGDEE